MTIPKSIDKQWRLFATGFSFTVFGIGAFFIAIGLLLFLYPIPFSKTKKQIWTRRTISFATRFYVRMMRAFGLLSFEFKNIDRLGNSGELIIANHPSLLDVVFILSVVPDACCIVKEALWRNPFTFGAVSMAGYISNNSNGPELVDKASKTIKTGQSLIIFPEGTRTSNLEQLNFQRGAANIALKAACPIRPILIGCEPMTLRKHESWYQIPVAPPLFTIEALDALVIKDCIDTNRPSVVQANHLNQYLQQKILSELQVRKLVPKDESINK